MTNNWIITLFAFIFLSHLLALHNLYAVNSKKDTITITSNSVRYKGIDSMLENPNRDNVLLNYFGSDRSQWGNYKLLNFIAQNASTSCFEQGSNKPLFMKGTFLEYVIPSGDSNCIFDIIWTFKKIIHPASISAYRTINAFSNIQGEPNSVKNWSIPFGDISPYRDKLIAEITLSTSHNRGWDRTISLYYEGGEGNRVEMARLITPFASKGLTYKIYADISNYISLLTSKNSETKNISVTIEDFTKDYIYSLNFYVLKRKKPLITAPVEVQKIYENNYTTLDQIQNQQLGVFPSITYAPSNSKVSILTRITGHAHAEQSIGTIHSLKITANNNLYLQKDFKIDRIWSDDIGDDEIDGDNELNQGQGVALQVGTVAVIRQGWVPGKRVTEKTYEIPQSMLNSVINVSYNIPTYGTSSAPRSGVPVYNISIQALKYQPETTSTNSASRKKGKTP